MDRPHAFPQDYLQRFNLKLLVSFKWICLQIKSQMEPYLWNRVDRLQTSPDIKWMKLEENWLSRFFCSSIVFLHSYLVVDSCTVFKDKFQVEPVSWKRRTYLYSVITVPNGTVPWKHCLKFGLYSRKNGMRFTELFYCRIIAGICSTSTKISCDWFWISSQCDYMPFNDHCIEMSPVLIGFIWLWFIPN